MLHLFFIIGWIATAIATVCGLTGYVWKEARWANTAGEYLSNFGRMVFQAAWGIALIWLYTELFGWPEPD